MLDKNEPIFIAGHKGMVGSAVSRELQARGYANLLTSSRSELDLRRQSDVRDFFSKHRPAGVILAAARVGGIAANAADNAGFLLENLQIECNVISSAAEFGCKRLLFLGSSCIYPKLADQPISETSLLTGPLEPTNEGYALAKIAGLKLCEYLNRERGLKYISAMPTNLYGVGDNFHPENSHVIPGMLRRFHEAKVKKQESVTVWGSGTPKREFLCIDDLAKALVLLFEKYDDQQTINVGSGEEVTIKELAELMKSVTGYTGKILWDSSRPDGTPRKLLDSSKIRSLGWAPKILLKQGLEETYAWALQSGVFK